jgi:hypothetical protein
MGLVFLTAVTSYGAAQGTTVVPQDSRYRTGRLDNGIMYYIQENNLPGGQMHFALVQKPVRTPFFEKVLQAPDKADVEEGIAGMERTLKELLITAPSRYRPHLTGVFLAEPSGPTRQKLLYAAVWEHCRRQWM